MATHTAHDQITELVRFATQAPSSHNTQPWRFELHDGSVSVRADTDRWLEVADRDKRELFISLGCAVENLVIAARHEGREPEVTLHADSETGETVATVSFGRGRNDQGASRGSESGGLDLFAEIPRRRTSHRPFDGRRPPAAQLDLVRSAGDGHGVELTLPDDDESIRRVADLTAEADREQFGDPAWRRELGRWIGQGVLGARWPVSRIAQMVVTHADMGESTGRKDAALINGSPSVGILWTYTDTHDDHVRAGRAYERIALAASAMGIATHPVSQALEIPRLKDQVAAIVPAADAVPHHVFRLGYATGEERARPRRRAEQMIATERPKDRAS